MLTLDEAKRLKYREVLVDGHGKRWYVTAVKTWKRKSNAHRIKVSLKHGLYVYDAITESDFYEYGNGQHVCPFLSRDS